MTGADDTGPVPDVSVLLVNWNTREMTLECLRSLYRETPDLHFETIVLDNASHDGSAEAIAAEFPQVRFIASEENLGFARATNRQVGLARAPRILLLNTDTVVVDRAIERLVAGAAATPDRAIWGGRTLFADGSLNATSCWYRISPWSVFCFATGLGWVLRRSRLFNPERFDAWRPGEAARVDIVTGCLFLIERDLWQRLDGFDPAFFMYGEEADLCLRAAALGARPTVFTDATIIHHGGGSAPDRADRLIYVWGSRIGLVGRHFTPGWRGFGRLGIVAGVGLRAAAYGVAARLRRSAGAVKTASTWAEVWRRRPEWTHGPRSTAHGDLA